jgi:hypothetical protein
MLLFDNAESIALLLGIAAGRQIFSVKSKWTGICWLLMANTVEVGTLLIPGAA